VTPVTQHLATPAPESGHGRQCSARPCRSTASTKCPQKRAPRRSQQNDRRAHHAASPAGSPTSLSGVHAAPAKLNWRSPERPRSPTILSHSRSLIRLIIHLTSGRHWPTPRSNFAPLHATRARSSGYKNSVRSSRPRLPWPSKPRMFENCSEWRYRCGRPHQSDYAPTTAVSSSRTSHPRFCRCLASITPATVRANQRTTPRLRTFTAVSGMSC
jgi:hypothetical protein